MAKLRDHEGIKARIEALRVSPRALCVEPGFNVRDLDAPAAREALDQLKADIRENGVQVPLEIRMADDRLIVTSGHRRLKVVMELIEEGVEIETVPAIAEPRFISEADRVARIATFNSGEPLTQLEKAEIVRRLLVYGWERKKIAARLGFKTEQQVANLEILISAPEGVREAVRIGEVSASAAVNLVRNAGDNATEALAEARETAKASGRTKITPQSIRKPSASPPAPPAAVVAEGPIAKLDKAIMLLSAVVGSPLTLSHAAEVSLHQPADITSIVEWLSQFADRLADKVAARATAQRQADPMFAE